MLGRSNEKITLIKIDAHDKVRGFYALLTNGSVKCLPDEKYLVPKHCLDILNKENIHFQEIGK